MFSFYHLLHFISLFCYKTSFITLLPNLKLRLSKVHLYLWFYCYSFQRQESKTCVFMYNWTSDRHAHFGPRYSRPNLHTEWSISLLWNIRISILFSTTVLADSAKEREILWKFNRMLMKILCQHKNSVNCVVEFYTGPLGEPFHFFVADRRTLRNVK